MWAILIAHLAQNWGYWILQTDIPTYINYILKFNIKSVRYFSDKNSHTTLHIIFNYDLERISICTTILSRVALDNYICLDQ